MAGLFNPPPNRRSVGLGYDPPQHEQLLKATATGISGRTYEFQVYSVGTAYFDRPGVYIFLKPGMNTRWEAVYIGETQSFASRLTENLGLHHQWQSIRAEGATHIGTLHVPGGLAAREAIETDLRRAIPTACNRQ